MSALAATAPPVVEKPAATAAAGTAVKATPVTLNAFFQSDCGMSAVTAKKFSDSLEAKGIDGLKLAGVKAKDGSLRPILTKIAADTGVDDAYVSIILDAIKANAEKEGDANLNKQQKEVDAVLKAAREYREAAVKSNTAELASAHSTLDAALKKVAPSEGWNVPTGADLLPKMDQLIKDLTSLSAAVVAGNFDSDHQLLSQVSNGALRKASLFLPGGCIGQRAPKTLFSFKSGITKSELSVTSVLEEHFSSNSVGASYQNDLVKDGSANSVTAEAGAFFGVGAVAVAGSRASATTSESLKKINTLTEARVAIGLQVHCVQKASFEIKLDDLTLEPLKQISSEAAASAFLEAYGTHIITTPQILGGLYVLKSKVTFANEVKVTSYSEALTKTLKANAAISGWGAGDWGIGKGSAATASESAHTAAAAGGKTSSNDTYSAITTIELLGPSCLDAAVFRTSLNNGNKSWNFINNGLSFEVSHRGRVINQITPVWELFDRAGRSEEAVLIRAAWINRVIDTEAILDIDSFFSKLLYNTLNVDTLTTDSFGWQNAFSERLARNRRPTGLGTKTARETKFQEGAGKEECTYLDRHVVGASQPITQFRLDRSGQNIRYRYETAEITANGSTLLVNETEAKTAAEDGAREANRYLDRHLVKAPQGRVLTGFQLVREGDKKIYYKYKHAQLSLGERNFTYAASAVVQSETRWEEGADSSLAYLDRHDIRAPEGSLLVGFRLQRRGDNINYVFWHVPVSAIQRE